MEGIGWWGEEVEVREEGVEEGGGEGVLRGETVAEAEDAAGGEACQAGGGEAVGGRVLRVELVVGTARC